MMSEDESDEKHPDSAFRTEVHQRTHKLGEAMKLASKDTKNRKHFQTCLNHLKYVNDTLIPRSLAAAGLKSPENVWGLDFSPKKKWGHGSIVLVAHVTTEKRRLVIINTRGTALSVPAPLKVDMIALNLLKSTGKVFVMKLKHLNLISTRKTWWTMNKGVLDMGLKADYDEATDTFSIREEDQATLKSLYEKHVYGMEKSPKAIPRIDAHICLEQFALHMYPTPEWRKKCLAERAGKSTRMRLTKKPVNYGITEGPNLKIKKRKAPPFSVNKKRTKQEDFLNAKIIWLDVTGHRLTDAPVAPVMPVIPVTTEDAEFLSCLDRLDKPPNVYADRFIVQIGLDIAA